MGLMEEGSRFACSPELAMRWNFSVPKPFRYLLSCHTFEDVKAKLGIETMEELGILRWGLLTKGSKFNISQLLIRYNNRTRPPIPIFRHMITRMAELGFGTVQLNGRSVKFQKNSPLEIDKNLLFFCGVTLDQYRTNYEQYS